jgi:monothiol glutaredoxin
MPTRPPVHPAAALKQQSLFADTVAEVARTVAAEPVVVVGVAWNGPAKRARKLLDAQGIAYRYLEYGNYVRGWRRRVAIKLWSGWPTFPQVFVRGTLVGGASDVDALIRSGELQKLLAA